MRIKHFDPKNALSILEAAEKQMKYTLSLEISDESAFNIIRNIYECFRMIGDAILVAKGKSSEDHAEQIRAIEQLKVSTERPLNLINSLRRIRHNINYYGYSPKKIEADDIVLFAKLCFTPVLKAAKTEIGKTN